MNKKIFEQFIYSPIYWLFTGTFFVENSDKKLVIFALVSLIASIAIYGRETIVTNIKKPLNVQLIVTTIYLGMFYYIYGGSSQEIRACIVMLILFISFPQHLLTGRVIDRLLFIGSLFSIGFILYNKYTLGIDRAIPHTGGGFNPIPYASAVSITGLISIYRFIKTKKIMLLIPTALYSAAIIFTQTRGVILPFFAITPLLFVFSIYSFNKKSITISFIALLCLTFIGYKLMGDRVERTIQEIHEIQKGNLTTSVGLRLQFFDVALQLIKERPVLGFGDQHAERLQDLYHEGKVSQAVAQYSPTSYHNQYLDTLVKKGIIGLILLLILQSLPLIYAYKYKASRIDKLFAFCLVSLFVGICIAATPFRQALPMVPILFSIYYTSITFNKKEEQDVK